MCVCVRAWRERAAPRAGGTGAAAKGDTGGRRSGRAVSGPGAIGLSLILFIRGHAPPNHTSAHATPPLLMVWRHLAQGAKEWVGKGADTVARGERTAPRLPRPAGGTPSPPPLNPFPSLPAVRDPHPPPERLLYAFATPADLARWAVYSDAEFGGSTTASLAPSADFPVSGRKGRAMRGERERGRGGGGGGRACSVRKVGPVPSSRLPHASFSLSLSLSSLPPRAPPTLRACARARPA